MRLTLQTAALALDWLADRGVVFETSADWQEISDKPCDTGSLPNALTPFFPQADFAQLDPVWPDKTSAHARRYANTRSAILVRGVSALAALSSRAERLIFVVSHSGFLRTAIFGYGFFNGDYRTFRFAPELSRDGDTDSFEPKMRHQVLLQDENTLAGGMGLSSAGIKLDSMLSEQWVDEDGGAVDAAVM